MGIPKRNQPKDEAEKGRPSPSPCIYSGVVVEAAGEEVSRAKAWFTGPAPPCGAHLACRFHRRGGRGNPGWAVDRVHGVFLFFFLFLFFSCLPGWLGWRADSGRLPLSVGMTGGARTRCWAGRVDRGAWKRSRPRVRWMRRRVVGEKN